MNEGIPSFKLIQEKCKNLIKDEVSVIVDGWTTFVKQKLETPTAFSSKSMEITVFIPRSNYNHYNEKTLKNAAEVFNREFNKNGWNTPLSISYDDEGDLVILFKQKVTI